MRLAVTVLAAVILMCVPALGEPAPARLGPGQEGKLEIKGYKYPCVIYVPIDYKDGTPMPAIFHMHGAGCDPTTAPFRQATAGKGYIVVGLSYATYPNGGKFGISIDPKTLQADVDAMVLFIDKVRKLVDETWGIDQEKVFLSGFSMGGRAVDCFGFTPEARGLYRGYCLISSGPMKVATVDFSVAWGLPVLMVNGENDPNLKTANAGRPLLDRAGAAVMQAVLPGEGHIISDAKLHPVLSKWLQGIAEQDSRAAAAAEESGEPIFRGLALKYCRAEAAALRDKTLPLEPTLATLDKLGVAGGDNAEEAAKLAANARAWAAKRKEALKAASASRPAATAQKTADFLPRVTNLPEEKELSGLLATLTADKSVRELMKIRADLDAVGKATADHGTKGKDDPALAPIVERLKAFLAAVGPGQALKAEAQEMMDGI